MFRLLCRCRSGWGRGWCLRGRLVTRGRFPRLSSGRRVKCRSILYESNGAYRGSICPRGNASRARVASGLRPYVTSASSTASSKLQNLLRPAAMLFLPGMFVICRTSVQHSHLPKKLYGARRQIAVKLQSSPRLCRRTETRQGSPGEGGGGAGRGDQAPRRPRRRARLTSRTCVFSTLV